MCVGEPNDDQLLTTAFRAIPLKGSEDDAGVFARIIRAWVKKVGSGGKRIAGRKSILDLLIKESIVNPRINDADRREMLYSFGKLAQGVF
jgi:hypothetical protein